MKHLSKLKQDVEIYELRRCTWEVLVMVDEFPKCLLLLNWWHLEGVTNGDQEYLNEQWITFSKVKSTYMKKLYQLSNLALVQIHWRPKKIRTFSKFCQLKYF